MFYGDQKLKETYFGGSYNSKTSVRYKIKEDKVVSESHGGPRFVQLLSWNLGMALEENLVLMWRKVPK